MSLRKLQNIGIENEIIQKLVRCNIANFRDILSKTEMELIQILDLPIHTVKDIVHKVSLAAAPSGSTVLDIYTKKNTRTFEYLPSSLSALDTFLMGGIPSGSLTEIVGPAGVGKSQFCHMLSILATLPQELNGLDGSVCYFDTESSFSANRLIEMAQAKVPEFFSNPDNLVSLSKKVMVYRMNNSIEIIEKLKSLEEIIIQESVKLIILDSVASVVRKEFDSNNVAKRQDLLSKEAAILKYLAETFNIPIIVVNQVTTKYEPSNELNSNNNKRSYVTPALGTVWSHSVNNRLVLEYFGEGRRMTIAKSPISPVVSFPYCIKPYGIELLTSKDKQFIINENPENYWEMKIIPRSSAAPGMICHRTVDEFRVVDIVIYWITLDSQHHVSVSKQAFTYPQGNVEPQKPFFMDAMDIQ